MPQALKQKTKQNKNPNKNKDKKKKETDKIFTSKHGDRFARQTDRSCY